jgi:ribose transport system ATP-binding protein
MIYQELNLALHLSAQENILLGSESARGGWIDRAASRERARAALAQLGHETLKLERPAGAFSIAEQQVIEIARALLRKPQVLIMDEPTSSLTQADTEKLFATIARLRAQGVSVIYISHFLEECRLIADRFTVLKDGETVGGGEMKSAAVEQLVRLMTGREVRELYARSNHPLGGVVLEVKATASAPRLKRASLTLRAGEIVGLAGLIGAGRTDLLRAIFALDAVDAGEVCIVDAPAGPCTPRTRWAQGLGFVSENRKEEGLMLSQSIADNLTLTKQASFGRFGWIDGGRQRAAADRWIRELGVKCRDAAQPIGQLSGGNQQKAIIARWLATNPRVLILDEPTRGIDIAAKQELMNEILALARGGTAVLFISAEIEEVVRVSDRIVVLRDRAKAGELPRGASDDAVYAIIAQSTGHAAATPGVSA